MADPCLVGVTLGLNPGLEPTGKHTQGVGVDEPSSLGGLMELAIEGFAEAKFIRQAGPLAADPVFRLLVSDGLKVTRQVGEVVQFGGVVREFHVIILS